MEVAEYGYHAENRDGERLYSVVGKHYELNLEMIGIIVIAAISTIGFLMFAQDFEYNPIPPIFCLIVVLVASVRSAYLQYFKKTTFHFKVGNGVLCVDGKEYPVSDISAWHITNKYMHSGRNLFHDGSLAAQSGEALGNFIRRTKKRTAYVLSVQFGRKKVLLAGGLQADVAELLARDLEQTFSR